MAILQAELIAIRAEQNLQRQLDWHARFDARVGMLLSIGIAMLGFLATESPPIQKWGYVSYIAVALSVAPIAFMLVQIYFTQYPRTAAPNSSLVYFGTIAALEINEFHKGCCDRTEEEYVLDLCHQAHVNSQILVKKFSALKYALMSLLIATGPWLFTIIWFRITKS